MQGDIRRRHSQSRVLQPPRTLPTKTIVTTMRHSASSPQGISQSLPASILKDGHVKAMSEKPIGYKEMRKGRRISSENNAYPASLSGSSPRVTFDESMPAPPPPSSNHGRSYDAESIALRALRHRRTSLPVNTHHAEMAPSNIAEARGLIVDMLADRELPSNVTTCLKAVAQLLNAPSFSVNSFHFADLGLPRVVENPFSGEQLVVSTASKPRVSNITFSTVTSATGLPTIAVEPSRPRSSSYWKPHDTRDGSSSATGAAASGAETATQCPPPSPSPSTTTAPVKTPSSKPATATPSPVPPSPHPITPASNTIIVAPATSLGAGGGPATSPLLSPTPSTSACRSPGPSGNRVSFVLNADDSDESTATTTTAVDDAGPMTVKVPDGTVFDTEELERDRILNEIAEWGFPIFHIAERYKCSVLTRITYKIFKETDLFNVFKLPYETFFTYFHALEMGYWDIPYHNRIHAADVLHACYYLTVHPVKPLFANYINQKRKRSISSYMSPLELMALFTAAAMHDYDHPGRTNAFLVASEDCKAILYNDRSVLENHHAAESWRLLCQPGNNFICNLDAAETKRFRYLVLEYILATDLKQHFDIIMQYTDKVPEVDLTNEADRVLISQMLIKLADVNSPAKPAGLHRQWTERICQEFYLQGDDEKRLNLQVSPYMNRHEPDVPRLQDSFISHIVGPLVSALYETGILPEQPGLSEPEITMNLANNHQKWLREIRLARIEAGELDENDIEEDPGTSLPNGTHPPSMQCLPEEESEDSCSNSGGTLNNNTEEFVPSPSPVTKPTKDLSINNKKPPAKENGCLKSEKPLTNGNGNATQPPVPKSPPPSDSPPTTTTTNTNESTLGRFEKKLGIPRRYFASMLRYLPSGGSSGGSNSASSSATASGSATPTATTPKFAPKRQPRSKSVSVSSRKS